MCIRDSFGGNVVRNGTSATFGWTATSAGPFNARYRAVGSTDWIETMGIAAVSYTHLTLPTSDLV